MEANSPAVLPHLPARALEIVTPLRVEAWHSHLHQFPDKRFSGFILRGLQEGFRIGFESVRPYRSSNRNMKSAHEHPMAVQTYLDRVQQAIHYLDDFLFLGPPASQVCTESLHTALRLCKSLGVPVAPDKKQRGRPQSSLS